MPLRPRSSYLLQLRRWYLTRPILFTILAFSILLILPAILGASYVRLTESGKMRLLRGFLRFPRPDPTACDYHFRKGRAYWVWLTFKNGKVMAGLFGPNSFASSFPHKRDLYVEKLLRLDENGDVVELIENSSGALVAMEDLERIEFFELDEVRV